MTIAVIPNRPAGTAVRSIEQILANFDAITNVINGNIDYSNLASVMANKIALEMEAWPATTISAGTIVKCLTTTYVDNTLCTYNASTGVATIVMSGDYMITINNAVSGATGVWAVFVNGGEVNTPQQGLPGAGVFVLRLAAGQTVGVGAATIGGCSGLVGGNTYYGGWTLTRL